MSRPTILFRGPVKTRSGYGAHARDLLYALREMDLFDIKIDSCMWGNTPMTALEDNEYHQWIEQNITTAFEGLPDIYVQVTIPNEFRRFGKVNIGITAGIETTVAPKDWVDGCNQMDLVITTSNFSRDVLIQTVYNENDRLTGRLIKQHRIEKPIKVLFEGVDLEIYNNKTFDENIFDLKEDFAFLFVGHWLKGDMGQDRKDVGMLIKCFVDAFADNEKQPALVLKTSSATFSVQERETFRKRIEAIVGETKNPPPIYLLFGELKDEEMNQLYNHPKIKSMISITKGEGFGRPLLEFSMTGKPIIASNWSGHKDFLPTDKAIMLGGKLTDVHESAADKLILKEGKWFTVDYNQVIQAMKLIVKDYDKVLINAELLRKENENKFSMEKMIELFKSYMEPFVKIEPQPQMTKLNLPKLNKIK